MAPSGAATYTSTTCASSALKCRSAARASSCCRSDFSIIGTQASFCTSFSALNLEELRARAPLLCSARCWPSSPACGSVSNGRGEVQLRIERSAGMKFYSNGDDVTATAPSTDRCGRPPTDAQCVMALAGLIGPHWPPVNPRVIGPAGSPITARNRGFALDLWSALARRCVALGKGAHEGGDLPDLFVRQCAAE